MMKAVILVLGGALCSLLPAIPATAAGNPATPDSAVMRNNWPPETLSGTITMVDPARNLLVVEGPDRASFDMVVTPETRIRAGNQRLDLQELSPYQNKPVSIRFIPERRGDVAEWIHVNG